MIDNLAQRKIINRLKRAEGQMRGLSRMVELHESNDSIFIQIKAVKSALSGIEKLLADASLDILISNNDSYSPEEIKEHIRIIKKHLT